MRMMPATAIAALVLAVSALPAQAQVVSGRILEAGSARPIGAAAISLMAGGRPLLLTESDSLGRFEIPAPEPGWYRLRVERLGYETVDTDSLSVESRELVEIVVRLGVTALRLDPIMVVERRRTVPASEFERRMESGQRSGLGVFLTREDLERQANISVTDVLARVPLMSVRFDERGNAWPSTLSQGGCTMALFLNGARMNFGPGETIDHLITPDFLEGVEIYRNQTETPPNFMGIDQCGAVVFWSREPESSRGGAWRYLLGIGAMAGMAVIFVVN